MATNDKKAEQRRGFKEGSNSSFFTPDGPRRFRPSRKKSVPWNDAQQALAEAFSWNPEQRRCRRQSARYGEGAARTGCRATGRKGGTAEIAHGGSGRRSMPSAGTRAVGAPRRKAYNRRAGRTAQSAQARRRVRRHGSGAQASARERRDDRSSENRPHAATRLPVFAMTEATRDPC